MADNLNESINSSEHGEDDMIVKKLKDPDLWVRVKVTRNIKVTNIEMAQAVYASVTLNNPDVIVPKDILATQYHSDDAIWFITMSTKAAKMHVLANNVITVKDKTFAVEDYSTLNHIRKKKWIRLSIHELPQSLSNKYVEEWVDTFAKRETPVKRHKEEDRRRREDDEIAQRFSHLYTGHRYCYVSQIYEHKDRYSDMQIPDPRNERDLIPTQVVLYYNGQPPINCHFCYLDHPAKECPDRPVQKCFLCNSVGHTKYNCPTADLGPTCFKCNKRGHMKNNCDQNTKSPISSVSSHSIEKPRDQSSTIDTKSDRVALNQDQTHTSVNVLHELLDKCMQPSSGPSSPDLMKKVEDLLISAAKSSQINDKEVQITNEQIEESTEEGGLVQNKVTKAKVKQSDIRKHLSGASSRFNEDDSETEPKNKKKSMKERKKRSISTSPNNQNESKKGRQDEEESGSATEYESPNTSGSESGGSYDPP